MASDATLPGAAADRALLVAHVDYTGRLRGRIVPPERAAAALRAGVTFNRANLNLDLLDRLPPDPVLAPSSGDYATVGIASTWRPYPRDRGLGMVFTRFTELDGTPWQGCPRSALQRQVERLAAAGLRAIVGFEQEGYLLGADGSAPAGRREFSAVGSLRTLAPFREALLQASAASGVPLLQFSKEMGPHQFEFNLPPRDPLAAAEDLVVTREAAHAAAAALDQRATFMPKPWSQEPSSGLHVHLSLHADAGGNAMLHPTDPADLSPTGQHAVAGLLRHARAIASIAMPTVNSMRRLQGGQWTPVLAAWSPHERDALVRWAGAGQDRRIEYRGADGCASPYLLLSVLLGAISEGVEEAVALDASLRIGGPVDHGVLATWRTAGRPVLPRSVGEATDAFEADGPVRETVGEPIASVLVQVRRSEQDALDREVGPWERDLLMSQF